MRAYLALVALAAYVTQSYSTDFRLPPSIVKQCEQKVITYIPEGHARLDCEAVGYPKPSYKWLKNGEELNLNAQNIKSNPAVTGTIEINPLYTLDEGYYQCVAENPYGKVVSNVIYLERAVLGNFQNPDDIYEYDAKEGEDFVIPCQSPKSIPDATFKWQTVESKSDKYPNDLRLNSRMNIDTSGNLYFSNVIPADSQDGRLYLCSAYNPEKKETKHGSLSQLRVASNPNATDVAPTILFHTEPPDNVALIGSTIILTCIFGAKPTPSIAWMRQGDTLPSGRYEYGETKNYLIIRDLLESDEGVYTCTGSNSVGSLPQDINLSIESTPTFTSSSGQLTNINKTAGETASMECIAEAEPIASLSWFVNGDPMNIGAMGARYKLSPDNTVLTIDAVCKDCASGNTDLKVFSCNASNVHGYSYISGYLNVLLQTQITLHPEDFELTYGEPVIFDCGASSDDSTPVTIDWLRDGERIVYQPGHMEKAPNNSLVIYTDREEDAGASFAGGYSCRATSGYSSATSTMSTLSLPPGPVPTEPMTSASLGIWGMIIGIIVLLVLLILLICCCQKYMKGDTYKVDEKERSNGNNPVKELEDSGFHDYKRPDDDAMKRSRVSITESLHHDTDDECSLEEYGDVDTGRFKEDGSFIGLYTGETKKTTPHYYGQSQDSVV